MFGAAEPSEERGRRVMEPGCDRHPRGAVGGWGQLVTIRGCQEPAEVLGCRALRTREPAGKSSEKGKRRRKGKWKE